MFISKRQYRQLIEKLDKIMAQNDQLLAIATELQESGAQISGVLTQVLADITTANTAGTPVPQTTLDALQSAADGIKTTANAIANAINPPAAPVEETPAPEEPTATAQ